MAISTELIRTLREKTGAGIMDSKRALEEANGDVDKAVDYLRTQGLAKAGKKSGREASQGLVEPYIHGGGRIGALVEVNCETDFVARTADFRSLAHDVAMQVAATQPRYVSESDIPEGEMTELEKEFGDRKQAIEATVLLSQPFIKDPQTTVNDVVKEGIARLGENIVVRRFARFELGTSEDAELDANEG